MLNFKNFVCISLLFVVLIPRERLFASDTLHLEGGSKKVASGPTSGPKYSKHQWIVKRARLFRNGLSVPVFLNGIGIQALDQAFPLKSITIKMGIIPNDTSFVKKSGQANYNYFQGLSTVFQGANIPLKVGYNYISFSHSFLLPDTGDLIIEFCKELDAPNPKWGAQCLVSIASNKLDLSAGNEFNSLCGNKSESYAGIAEYNFHLLYDSLTVPPLADFSVGSAQSCDSVFEFINQTKRLLDSCLWDFGDNTTDTSKHPIHSYSSPGKYKVKLVAYNAYGVDSIEKWIEYNPLRQAASTCMGASTNSGSHTGIKFVQLGDINNSSASAQTEGNADYSCLFTHLKEGAKAPLKVIPFRSGQHQIKVWFDANANAKFDWPEEMIFSGSFSGEFNDSITLPGTSPLNTALLLRIAVSPQRLLDNPCQNIIDGQFEDYSIVLDSNLSPPKSKPLVKHIHACIQKVEFGHSSLGHIDSLRWDFGNGKYSKSANASTVFSTSGYKTVWLKVYGYGGVVDSQAVSFVVPPNFDTPKPMCVPTTPGTSGINGIGKIIFQTRVFTRTGYTDSVLFENLSQANIDGYQDFTCQKNIVFRENKPATVFIQGTQGNMDYYAWLDYNNDGNYTTNELVGYKYNTQWTTVSLSFSGIPIRQPLRLRVGAFLPGSAPDPCRITNRQGEYEDYTLYYEPYGKFIPDTLPPEAQMKSGAHYFCEAKIDFEDSSSSNVAQRYWYFGDGSLDSGKRVTHTYNSSGDYAVQLVVANPHGTDTMQRIVTVSLDSCPTYYMMQDSIVKLSGCKGGKILIDALSAIHGSPSTPKYMQVRLAVPDSHELTLDVIHAGFNTSDIPRSASVHSGPHNQTFILGRIYRVQDFVETYRPINNGRHLTVHFTWNDAPSWPGLLEMRYRCLSYKNEKDTADNVDELHFTSNSNFSLFPNPSQEKVFLIHRNEVDFEVNFRVFDLQGSLISSGAYNKNSGIDIVGLSQGIYLIKIENKYWSETHRLIKH